MNNKTIFLKPVIRRILKVLKILLIVIVCLYAAAYIYLRVNKDKIIRQLTEQAGRKLNGKLTIGDADISLFRTFPGISIQINDISLTDTVFAQHGHAFFSAKSVYVKISLWKLLKKEQALTGLRVDNGSIYLFTDTSGYTNTYLMKSKKDPAGGPKKTSGDINLQNIELNNVNIILDDRQKEKLHNFDVHSLYVSLNDSDSTLSMSTDANMKVNSLAFNLPRGTFLKGADFSGNFDLRYGKESQLLSFDSINVKIGGIPFNMTGSFDLGDKNPAFTLRVHARNFMYEDVKKLMPKRIDSSLSMVTLDKPLDADAQLNGPLHGGDPYILATWNVKHTKLTSVFMDFDDASFTGYFSDEVVPGLPRKDPNSIISISNFTASWHSLPVSSNNIQILNLSVPELTADLHSAFPLTSLNEVIKTNSLQLTSGKGEVVLDYKGPLQRNSNTNAFLNGYIGFKDGTVLYASRNVELKNVNGVLNFKNSDVFIQNLQCNVLNNKIVMNGSAKNLLTLVNTDPNSVKIDYSIYSPSLNLNSFLYLLKKGNKSKAAVKSSNSKDFGSMAVKIDDLLDESSIHVNLVADKLIYKNFTANNATADISLLQDRYLINNAGMSVAGGKMNLSAQLLNNNETFHSATVNAVMTNVNVKQIFAAFDNFGQTAIASNNLEGNLTAKINSSLNIKDDGAVMPSSVNGTVDFSLKNGALNDFEPIKKLQRFVFKKRDFDNIRFAELKDKLEISKSEIKINRMEIESTVLSLFVEGLYSQRGNTDLSIQVPLNNLKKRGDDYNPVNIGTDKKGGRSIYIRGRPGSDGTVDFKLDLFNKFQKDKNNAALPQ